MKTTPQKGISVIEVVVVVFVTTVLLYSVVQLALLSLQVSREKKLELRAAYYVHEGVEAIRAMRDESWATRIASLTASSVYYIIPASNSWIFSASNPGPLDGIFTRTAIMQNVSRDAATDDIDASGGGVDDPDTKRFTVSAAWNTQTGPHAFSMHMYITNLFAN